MTTYKYYVNISKNSHFADGHLKKKSILLNNYYYFSNYVIYDDEFIKFTWL